MAAAFWFLIFLAVAAWVVFAALYNALQGLLLLLAWGRCCKLLLKSAALGQRKLDPKWLREDVLARGVIGS